MEQQNYTLLSTFQTLLAILPGLLICAWIFYQDRHNKEPLIMLFACFVAGGVSTFPTIELERYGIELLQVTNNSNDVWDTLLLTFGVVGVSEESVKFICIMLLAFPWRIFNEPLDGIVYCLIVGMGFATVENIIYSEAYGMNTVLLRAFTAIPAHAAFAIFMGYHLGLAKFSNSLAKGISHVTIGLLGAIILHGTYDFFILQTWIPELSLMGLVVLIICIIYTRRLVILHTTQSWLERKETIFSEDEISQS